MKRPSGWLIPALLLVLWTASAAGECPATWNKPAATPRPTSSLKDLKKAYEASREKFAAYTTLMGRVYSDAYLLGAAQKQIVLRDFLVKREKLESDLKKTRGRRAQEVEKAIKTLNRSFEARSGRRAPRHSRSSQDVTLSLQATYEYLLENHISLAFGTNDQPIEEKLLTAKRVSAENLPAFLDGLASLTQSLVLANKKLMAARQEISNEPGMRDQQLAYAAAERNDLDTQLDELLLAVKAFSDETVRSKIFQYIYRLKAGDVEAIIGAQDGAETDPQVGFLNFSTTTAAFILSLRKERAVFMGTDDEG